jgi:3-dehydroquinate synthase
MKIQASAHSYTVNFENGLSFLSELVQRPQSFFVIDRKVYQLYQRWFAGIPEERLMLYDALEENKVIELALEVCERMTHIPAKRNAWLISIGGGITQDVTGFAANILYRGVQWAFVPTTLLAACDSCIGGKTSLNYKGFKNLLGNFFSGLGEVVKFNILMGEQGIENIERQLPALLARDPATVRRFTESSLAFKKNYIEQDEFDLGVRVHLNFAHTFGHAFETVSHYAIAHGSAVALGTMVANHISLHRGWLDEGLVQRIDQIILPILPDGCDPAQWPLDLILAAIHKDKKQTDSNITAVLLQQSFDLKIVHDVQSSEIETALADVSKLVAKSGRETHQE